MAAILAAPNTPAGLQLPAGLQPERTIADDELTLSTVDELTLSTAKSAASWNTEVAFRPLLSKDVRRHCPYPVVKLSYFHVPL